MDSLNPMYRFVRKALQVHPDCPSEPDQSALSLYLQLGYVPSPTTWLRDVKQLPAGCWLTWQQNFWRQITMKWFLQTKR